MRLSCVLAGLALLMPSLAVTSQDAVSIAGFKDMSCGVWARSSNNKFERTQYIIWFRGFISGYNYAKPVGQILPDRLPSNETVELYVDKYCRDNPLAGFPGAAFKLVDELRGEQ